MRENAEAKLLKKTYPYNSEKIVKEQGNRPKNTLDKISFLRAPEKNDQAIWRGQRYFKKGSERVFSLFLHSLTTTTPTLNTKEMSKQGKQNEANFIVSYKILLKTPNNTIPITCKT